MSRGSGLMVIPVAVFLAILLMVLPVSADNNNTQQTTITTSPTTVVTTQTANVTPTTTVTTTQTANVTPTTTVTTTQTASVTPTTTVTTTRTPNATPTTTTVAVTQTTVVTTATPTMSVTETETTGSVLVYSSPTGASILIDGVYAGTTPRNIDGMPPGNHILRLEMSGYYEYEGSIYIVPGQTAQGYGTLQPINQVTSAAPTPLPTDIIPVIVTVATATPVPTQNTGLLANTNVLVAIIGAIAVLIAVAASIFTHVTPPKKE